MKLTFAGCRGNHLGAVLDFLPQLSDFEVTGICPAGCDIAALLERCRQLNFTPKIYPDYEQMLVAEKPFMSIVDGPFELHAPMSLAALQRGIHVLSEKPVALTLPELEQLTLAVQLSPAKLFAWHNLRYAPPFQTALEIVQSKVLGPIRLISARKAYKLGSRPEFYQHRATYGGTIPWVGIHALDWIVGAGGTTEVDRYFACDSRCDNFDHGDLEIAAQGQMVMANGILAQFTLDYLRPQAAPTHDDDQVRIVGQYGTVEVANGQIKLLDAHGETVITPHRTRQIFPDIIQDCLWQSPALLTPHEVLGSTRLALLLQQFADRIPTAKL